MKVDTCRTESLVSMVGTRALCHEWGIPGQTSTFTGTPATRSLSAIRVTVVTGLTWRPRRRSIAKIARVRTDLIGIDQRHATQSVPLAALR